MKFLQKLGKQVEFEVESWARVGLEITLEKFPIKEAPELPYSRTMAVEEIEDDEEFLHDCLSQERDENGLLARQILERQPFRPYIGDTWIFTVTESELDPLLKIMNNIRVGCWSKLGCPEDLSAVPMDPDDQHLFSLMHVCGIFQGALVLALQAPENG